MTSNQIPLIFLHRKPEKDTVDIKPTDPDGDTANNEDNDLLVAARNKTLEILQPERPEEDTLTAIAELLDFASRLVETFERKADLPLPVACKAGCHYCCFAQVALTPLEALLIGHTVQGTFPNREKADLLQHVEHNLKLTRGRALTERIAVWQSTPCIFLKNRRCAVHAIRPLICRAWHSLDAGQCQTAFGSKNPAAEMDSYPHRNYILGTIREGLQQGCRDLGCQARPIEMASAMEAYFSHKTPWQDWLARKSVF